jgi:Immunity protein Imm1
MSAIFLDLDDRSNPLNGSEVTTSRELCSVLDEYGARPAQFCELVAQNGFKLLLGVSSDLGCVQHSSCSGSPPYYMTANSSALDTKDCVKFSIDNEPTPVPRHYCLPMKLVKEIAVHFLATGERSAEVCWEEI